MRRKGGTGNDDDRGSSAAHADLRNFTTVRQNSAAAARAAWLDASLPLSHVIAIERFGPTAVPATRWARTSRAAALPSSAYFLACSRATIGISDLASETGTGILRPDLVADSIPNGREIWRPQRLRDRLPRRSPPRPRGSRAEPTYRRIYDICAAVGTIGHRPRLGDITLI